MKKTGTTLFLIFGLWAYSFSAYAVNVLCNTSVNLGSDGTFNYCISAGDGGSIPVTSSCAVGQYVRISSNPLQGLCLSQLQALTALGKYKDGNTYPTSCPSGKEPDVNRTCQLIPPPACELPNRLITPDNTGTPQCISPRSCVSGEYPVWQPAMNDWICAPEITLRPGGNNSACPDVGGMPQWYDPEKASCVPNTHGTLECQQNEIVDQKYGVCVTVPICVSGNPPTKHDEWPFPQTHPIYYTCDEPGGESPVCIPPAVLSPDRTSCITVTPVETCPTGTHGTPPNCVDNEPVPPTTCPAGTHGTPPNCVDDEPVPPTPCPVGTSGTPPNCVDDEPPLTPICPVGQHGVPPDCVDDPIEPPPETCPNGTTGTPPNCQPIINTPLNCSAKPHSHPVGMSCECDSGYYQPQNSNQCVANPVSPTNPWPGQEPGGSGTDGGGTGGGTGGGGTGGGTGGGGTGGGTGGGSGVPGDVDGDGDSDVDDIHVIGDPGKVPQFGFTDGSFVPRLSTCTEGNTAIHCSPSVSDSIYALRTALTDSPLDNQLKVTKSKLDQLIGGNSSCPSITVSMDFFNRPDIVSNTHCQLAEPIRPFVFNFSTIIFAIVAVMIFLKA